jgi:hypothetical protein
MDKENRAVDFFSAVVIIVYATSPLGDWTSSIVIQGLGFRV